MDEYLNILKACGLFYNIASADIPAMLECLSAEKKLFGKNEVIFAEGEPLHHFGIVLSGRVQIEQNDYWGNRSILALLEESGLFGEAFGYAGTPHLPVNVRAAAESDVMLIDCRKIFSGCSSACVFHTQLIQNMLRILAQKNVALTQKIETVTQRTTRGKLLAYFSAQAQAHGGSSFTIPFNRQQLADYLAVERSAMSAELSKMQKEGLIQYNKSKFKLC